jgi:hypothetical protein
MGIMEYEVYILPIPFSSPMIAFPYFRTPRYIILNTWNSIHICHLFGMKCGWKKQAQVKIISERTRIKTGGIKATVKEWKAPVK